MQIQVQPITVHKRVPLTISRGTAQNTTILWVLIGQDGQEGWGEASPLSVGTQNVNFPSPTLGKEPLTQPTSLILAEIERAIPLLEPFHPWQAQAIESTLLSAHIASAARAALDMALHDWRGKKLGTPLWQAWGLDPARIVPTSVTIGISSPAAACQRWQVWQDQCPGIQVLKLKMGNPEGIAADQALLTVLRSVVDPQIEISVDANGGWSLADAVKMSEWLAATGVKSIEQPLERGQEHLLPELYRQSPLPIFVDESCWVSQDIPYLADRVHGINIKLMKSGGLTEALRMIHTAQAHRLQIMLGCYSNTSLANTAALHLGPLVDYLDLDSQLNLLDDPFLGATLHNGRLQLNDRPGLGIRHHAPDT